MARSDESLNFIGPSYLGEVVTCFPGNCNPNFHLFSSPHVYVHVLTKASNNAKSSKLSSQDRTERNRIVLLAAAKPCSPENRKTERGKDRMGMEELEGWANWPPTSLLVSGRLSAPSLRHCCGVAGANQAREPLSLVCCILSPLPSMPLLF